MRIIGPDLDREQDCENILRSLPQWFGIEESLQMYVRDSKSLPGFGVEVGPTLTGFISLVQHFPKSWEVHCIAVLASERNKGLGTMLLDHAESWLSQQGAHYLQIKTIAGTSSDLSYAETREFYLSRGYEALEVFPTLWGSSNPALQLVKVLKNA